MVGFVHGRVEVYEHHSTCMTKYARGSGESRRLVRPRAADESDPPRFSIQSRLGYAKVNKQNNSLFFLDLKHLTPHIVAEALGGGDCMNFDVYSSVGICELFRDTHKTDGAHHL